MGKTFLERLGDGPVLGDGGYLLELEKRGYVQAGPFTPEVALTAPEALAELHREFIHAGAEVLQALTFYASEDKLRTVGLEGSVEELNRAAVRIARKVAGEADALVAGTLSLTWAYEPNDTKSATHVAELFDRQLAVHVDEGVDLVIAETFSWLGEAIIAAERAKAAGMPVVVTMSFEQVEPRSYEGDAPADCARRLVGAGADVVGVNCLRSPQLTLPIVDEMRRAVDGFVASQPAAFRVPAHQPDFTSLAAFPYELEPLQLTRAEMADYARRAHDIGVNFIGSCCGSVASHVREMAKALGKPIPEQRRWRIDYDKPMSAFEYYGHDVPSDVNASRE